MPREGWLDRMFEDVDRAKRDLPDWVWRSARTSQTQAAAPGKDHSNPRGDESEPRLPRRGSR